MAEAPKLYQVDPADLIDEITELWEGFAGKTLYPGQVEYQQVRVAVNREVHLRALMDHMVAMNLTSFSISPVLDYKAANWNLTRLAAQPAKVNLRFTMVPGHSGVIIPAGTRVRSSDGQVVVATDYEMVVAAGTATAEVPATSILAGTFANNKQVGAFNTIVDPIAFVQSVTSLTVSEGGSEEESDEQLRARIMLAPSTFSTAGSAQAYKFHTFSASPRIIDTRVLNGGDGIVNVYPLVSGGIETPTPILSLVAAKLNDDMIRPINDTINVISPTKMTYALAVTLWLKWGTVASVAQDRVVAALQTYVDKAATQLGWDVTLSQLTAAALKDNMDLVSDISFGAFTGLAVPPTSFPVCLSVAVVMTNYENPNS